MKHVAIILGYHNARLSMLSTDSVLAADKTTKVILVEPDARPDEIGPLLAKYEKNKRVDLMFMKENHFTAWGMNQGVKEALRKGYDIITVLNNDATVDKGYFQEVTRSFAPKKLPYLNNYGIVQPKTMFGFTDVIYSAGVTKNVLGFPRLRGHGEWETGQYNKPEIYEYASAVAMSVRAKVFKQVGMFDEDFEMYYDDIDFSIRARKDAGWQILYNPKAVARHHVLAAIGQSNGKSYHRTMKYSERNRLLLAKKNGFLTPKYVLMDMVHALKTCACNPRITPAIIEGKRWFWSGKK